MLMSNDNGSGNNGNGAGGRSSDLVYYVFAQLKELLGDGATLERAAQVARALSNEFQDLRKQGPLFDKDCIEITSIGAYAVTAFTAGGAYRIDRKQVEAAHAAARRYGQRVEVPPAMVAESSRTIDTVLEN
ncbi:hypothetical protein HYU19_05135 [Candidatus Woesearchaeota archaeon]|nr:hypothetical protein [Candidatus Woesearchaeota archaeon]